MAFVLPTTSGQEFLKRVLVYRKVLLDDGDESSTDPVYLAVPEDLSITTTTQVGGNCDSNQALSGLKIFTIQQSRLGTDVVSALQLYCTEIQYS